MDHHRTSPASEHWIPCSSCSPNEVPESAEDSGSPSGPESASTSISRTITPLAGESGARSRRRPIPRKGHTKSRLGCFNCKRRKVKCQETTPSCSNCTRVGLVCEYPERPRMASALSASITSSALVPSGLQSTPTQFTPEDMRYFHHFLVTAYPPLPIQGDQIWMQTASLSHSYDFLMHAMLGLAASHLDLHGGNCSSQALAHRVKAIQSLNVSLSKPCSSQAEGDARFAAMMALVFQASCMAEGMPEFLAMSRGCHIIANTAMGSMKNSLFREFTQEGYCDSVRRVIGVVPLNLDEDQEVLIQDFLRSLRALGPLCKSPLEVKFLASTESIANAARTSASEAFLQFAALYSLFNHASNEEFAPFIDPNNHPAQLLFIHFVLIEFAIGNIALSIGNKGARFAYRKMTCIAWMEKLADGLPAEYERYAGWPMNYVRRLSAR
ncbi:hypothetical protein B0T21DRAFT_285736 [Apiosordaria backusii]|uniref:Zn(2)-C6 fungal-type domain-containing protein n=1 Tax=Apiosordaria backusii TaxID=314023 RepID=A0AA40EHZ6_9PEZI|nr:hypothetical protein B0T21DRAFT_285736 [Apiosordaria backusii]